MKANLKTIITGKGREPIKLEDVPLNMKAALLHALSYSYDGKPADVKEAILIRKLFNKIDDAEDEIELKSEEVVKLKELAAKALFPYVAGAVILELEPE